MISLVIFFISSIQLIVNAKYMSMQIHKGKKITRDISSKNTFDVKKVWPSKVEC